MRRRSAARRRLHRLRHQNATGTEEGYEGGVIGEDGGSLWHRLLLKLVTYGVVFLLFRKFKERKAEEEKTKLWKGEEDAENSIGVDGGISVSRTDVFGPHRTFLAGPGIEVHAVANFLPTDLAVRWRDVMSYEWSRMDLADDGKLSNGGSAWKYATNNDGVSGQYNQKIRNLKSIAVRNATAQDMYKSGLFSYSKWEIDPSHPLVFEMEKSFEGEELKSRVTRVLSKDGETVNLSSELSDLFVTQFSTGDFLSPHDDGVSGTWAFVISLVEGPEGDKNREWEQEFGGLLRFSCPYKEGYRPLSPQWCEVVRPAFNTALFFRTRPQGPLHEVSRVSWQATAESFRRFGITGWYMDETDHMSASQKMERDKMRSRTETVDVPSL